MPRKLRLEHPGTLDILGIANPTAAVTVNGGTAYRKGDYFDCVLPVSNASGPQYPSITVASSYVPLPLLTGEAAFGIAVLARPLQQGWIMIKVEGDCTKAEFVSALKGGAESKMRDRHITAIAIMEPHL